MILGNNLFPFDENKISYFKWTSQMVTRNTILQSPEPISSLVTLSYVPDRLLTLHTTR